MRATESRYHIHILQSELSRRKLKNSRYSLRAFASQLEMHPSALSRILAGKQELSLQAALSVIAKLSMTENQKHQFIASVAQERYQQALATLAPAIGAKGVFGTHPAPAHQRPLLETALSFSPDRILVLDRAGRCIVASPRANDHTSEHAPDHPSDHPPTGPEETFGKNASESGFPPDIAAKIQQQTEDVISSGEASSIEFAISERGRTEHFRRITTAILDDDGQIEAILVHIRQITAERNAAIRAEVLQELTDALSRALDPKQVASAVVATTLKVIQADTLALRAREGDKLTLLDGIPPLPDHPLPILDIGKNPHCAYGRAVHTALPQWLGDSLGPADVLATQELSVRLKTAGGLAIPLCVNNEVIGALGLGFKQKRIVSDEERTFLLTLAAVSAHALERARLYEEEHQKRVFAERGWTKFRTLIDSLDSLCFCITADGRMDDCNPAFRAWLGFDPLISEHLPLWWHDCVPADEIQTIADEFEKGFVKGQEFQLRLRLRHHLGDYRWVRISYLPSRDANRSIIAWIGHVRESAL
ncbi:MAG: PAS domain-containing protein [Bdellovibrionaceae bacterium]|nr:PAS domain-containing protein [Pseudobdellovibrionaceae bacterium]